MNRAVVGVFVAAVLVAAGVLTACQPKNVTIVTTTRDTYVTETAPVTYAPPPASSVAPLPASASPAAGENEKPCPYIASSQDQGATSVADIEGDRVYRTTVLTSLKPVGCRFYFWADPYEAVADIVPRIFPDARGAHNAMVLTATNTGTEAQSKPQMLPGIDAILYRTKFFGPDGARDWACVFAKGKVMVIVHTQRSDQSLSALLLAKAVAPRF